MANHGVIRVYNEVQAIKGKKDPSANYAKQTRGLVKGEGRVQEFEQFLSLDRGDKPLPAGDYEVVPGQVVLTRDGKVYLPFDLVPIKQAAKAA